jgi:hypothetical protein
LYSIACNIKQHVSPKNNPSFWGILADCKQYFDSKPLPITDNLKHFYQGLKSKLIVYFILLLVGITRCDIKEKEVKHANTLRNQTRSKFFSKPKGNTVEKVNPKFSFPKSN